MNQKQNEKSKIRKRMPRHCDESIHTDTIRCSSQQQDEETKDRTVGKGLSWKALVRYLHRPTDPTSLAVTRILYGILMMIDIPQERGMAYADSKWDSQRVCRFPLFDFLQPLPMEWMYMVYLVMFAAIFNVTIGLLYRCSCVIFLVCYWYLFLLDKSIWNNHSYLYGLLGWLLLITDGNRFCSVDGLLNPRLRDKDIPFWNYFIMRAQIFLVYFIAGLKKVDADWLNGFSMENLASHWVFTPFTLWLPNETVNYFIVHVGGFLLDLTVGFFLLWDTTRIPALFFCGCFNLMNSQIFSIGMFPYMMLATMPVFCHPCWPRSILSWWKRREETDPVFTQSDHCLYTLKSHQPITTSEKRQHDIKPGIYHYFSTVILIFYLALQLFLPYSHFITKGYNNWTNGLYGYSWDMMVHSWNNLHTRIMVLDKDSGHVQYLDPQRWTITDRWSSHADMAKQYGNCVKQNLQMYGFTNISLYLDVWKSLNGRFQQRFFDPRVDILEAEWSAFEKVPWVMPLLSELSDWRYKTQLKLKELAEISEHIDVVFVADFPGLHLENFVHEDLSNMTLELLRGQVAVEFNCSANRTLTEGERVQIPTGDFHTVYTLSAEPSCYMYTFVNTTDMKYAGSRNSTLDTRSTVPILQRYHTFWKGKYELFEQSFTKTAAAFHKILTGK